MVVVYGELYMVVVYGSCIGGCIESMYRELCIECV